MTSTKRDILRAALRLSPDDRLALAVALHESVERESLTLPEWQQRLLDERIAEDDAGTDPGEPWADVRRRFSWVGMIDDPTGPPARELEEFLEEDWPDSIAKDRG
jgi:putative addiction module component (TIGR02574 family)